METNEVIQELKAHEARETADLKQHMAEAAERFEKLECRLLNLETVLHQINGGVRVLMWLGGAIGIVVGWLGWFKDHVTFH